jgi:hypothetical protein
VSAKTSGFCKANRVQPELGDIITMLNVNVRRLQSFEAVEEEAKAGDRRTVGIERP